mmetsp:Transcript_17753/g.31726  ORF Transcript_17753/g.31726 Transcript_17753/m.31726 type:complete len:462 (+) Transcript_17753:84-1469(+)
MSGHRLHVCQGPECSKKKSKALVVDIEELAAGGCEVVAGGCLDHCAKGPNVEVMKNGKRNVIEGVSTFKKVEHVVKSDAGVKFSSTQAQVAALKYDIRRSQDTKDQATKVEKALKVLGGQAKGETTQPRLTAELLVLRARALMKENVTASMKDASRALELFPDFAPAHAALAVGFELMERWKEAADSISRALESEGVALDTREAYAIEKRMNDKCEALDAEEKAEKAKAKAAQEERAKAEEEAKQKAEAEAKQKAAAEAKKKAEAKRKAQAAAKKKREAEEKKKAEEEAKAKAEREAAEATAKAEREEAEAKAKAEREEAEVKARAEQEEAEAKAEEEKAASEVKAQADAEGNAKVEQQDQNETHTGDEKVEPVPVKRAPDAKAPPARSPYLAEAAVSKTSTGQDPALLAVFDERPQGEHPKPTATAKAAPPTRSLWGFIACCAPNPITDEGGEAPIQYTS